MRKLSTQLSTRLSIWFAAVLLLMASAAWAATSPQNSAPAAPPSAAQPQSGSASQAPTQPSAPPEATQATAAMQTFTSADGRFSVLLPGTPKQQSQQIALRGGASSTLYQFWVDLEDGSVTYMVMYNDYPSNYANDGAANVLARTRDGAANGKTLTSDVAINLNGVPGRAFTITDNDGWNYAVHQFFDGKRLYQLIVVFGKDHPATLTGQFMSSFRIQ